MHKIPPLTPVRAARRNGGGFGLSREFEASVRGCIVHYSVEVMGVHGESDDLALLGSGVVRSDGAAESGWRWLGNDHVSGESCFR